MIQQHPCGPLPPVPRHQRWPTRADMANREPRSVTAATDLGLSSSAVLVGWLVGARFHATTNRLELYVIRVCVPYE